MVELPLDDAASAYEGLAETFNDMRLSVGAGVDGLEGAVADALQDNIEGLHRFTSQTAEVLAELAGTVRDQHRADEKLRDGSLPVREIEELEEKAQTLERITNSTRSGFSLNTSISVAARMAREKVEHEKHRRAVALGQHTTAAATHEPRLRIDPPTPWAVSGTGITGRGAGEQYGGDDQIPGNTGSGGAGGSSSVAPSGGGGSLPSAGTGSGSAGSGSLDDSRVSTETSADGMSGGMGAAGMQPMMGQPMQAPQQPQMPSMSGTGAAGMPGMLGATPGASGAAGARNRKRDRKDEPRTDLTGAGFVAGGIGGAAAGAAAGAVDRGISVQGVTTKADTSGVGTQLSGGQGGKPVGGNPTGNMMRGGMMGPMMAGGLGSGASGTTRSRPDITQVIKDKELHGLDSLKDAVNGGIIGRDTAEPEDESGTSSYFDIEEWKRKNGKD